MPRLLSQARFPTCRLWAFVVSAVVIGVAELTDSYAGVLDDARTEARTARPESRPTTSPPTNDHNRPNNDCNSDDDDSFGGLIWDLTGGLFLHCVFGTTYEETTLTPTGQVIVRKKASPRGRGDMFAPFPYATGTPGIVLPPGWQNTTPYPFSARVAFEYGDDLDVIGRFAGTGLVESSSGWGIDASAHVYVERFDLGDHDQLAVGDVNVLFRVLQTERSQWRIGGGMNWLADSIDDTTGANFTMRADFFPVKPLILSGELDAGAIGHANTFHTRASIGFNIDQVEFFTGYDYRSIGSVHIEGPMLGVQFWY